MADYEDYLYDDYPYEEAHPDRLGAIAALFDLHPAPPASCRVLELGCGLGGNLIAMASALPGSTFVGVDLSAPQIEAGRSDARALGLTNIELRAMNILDVNDSFGTFDYILSHGVYSWVPPDVQAKMLALVRALLAPSGVAYISYNTLPGWHIRGLIRDALLRESGQEGTPEQRIRRARELLSLLAMAPSDASFGNAWMKSEVDMLERLSDSYILYEHLVKNNRPVYFKDFAHAAGIAGLRYLADAIFYTMVPERFGKAVAAKISEMSRTILDTEQYMDMLDMRYFRRTLLCHREVEVDRSLTWKRLSGLWISTPLQATSESPEIRSDTNEIYRANNRTEIGSTSPLLKAALAVLEQTYPRGVLFEDLCARAAKLLSDGDEPPDAASAQADRERLGANLLGLYANNQIDINVRALGCVTEAGERPQTSAVARLQARRGKPGVTTLRHRVVPVDAFDRSMLSRMDGARTLDEIIDGIEADVDDGAVIVQVDGVPRRERDVLENIAQQKLARFARTALLTG